MPYIEHFSECSRYVAIIYWFGVLQKVIDKNFEKCKGLLTTAQVILANSETNLVLVEDNEVSQMRLLLTEFEK